jgi:hypothetical protein
VLARLFVTTRAAPTARPAPVRWSDGVARSFLRKDLAITLRRTPARARAVAWVVLLALAGAVWALPLEPAAAATFSAALLLAARPLEAGARAQLVVALALATLLIGVLGATYGVMLFPRVVETVERLCDHVAILHLGRVVHTLARAAWGGPGRGPSPLEHEFLSIIRNPAVRENPA